MNTEHVSVPREDLEALIENALDMVVDDLTLPSYLALKTALYEIVVRYATSDVLILSRATPSDNGKLFEKYMRDEGHHDISQFDGRYNDMVVNDHWKTWVEARKHCSKTTAPRSVTAEDVERVYKRLYETRRECREWLSGAFVRTAIEAIGTLPHAAVPEGYVMVPVEPTEDVYDAAEPLTRHAELDLRAIYKAMIAAAPQPEMKP